MDSVRALNPVDIFRAGHGIKMKDGTELIEVGKRFLRLTSSVAFLLRGINDVFSDS